MSLQAPSPPQQAFGMFSLNSRVWSSPGSGLVPYVAWPQIGLGACGVVCLVVTQTDLGICTLPHLGSPGGWILRGASLKGAQEPFLQLHWSVVGGGCLCKVCCHSYLHIAVAF